MIIFEETNHLYTNTILSKPVISATTLLKPYFPFDAEDQLWRSAYKEYFGDDWNETRKKYFGWDFKPPMEKLNDCLEPHIDDWSKLIEIREEIRESWRMSGVNGTSFHLLMESKSYERGSEYNEVDKKEYRVIKLDKKFDNESVIGDLYKLEDGYYPELLTWGGLNYTHSDGSFEYNNLIAGQIDRCFIGTNKDGTRYVSISDYKGLSLDTPIATIDGFKNINEIKIGDYIFDGNGEVTKVKHVSKIHYNPCYKITFDTNDEIICDHEHKWVVEKRKSTRKYTKQEKIEYTTDELYDAHVNKSHVLKIKCTDLSSSKNDLPIDPYVLGLWIADGNRTCGSVTCINSKTWEEVKKRGYEIGIDHNRNNKDAAECRTILGLQKELKKLNLIKNKHFPMMYMRSDYNQRLDLLRGFMDGDGHFNKSRKRCVMNTTKVWQADGLVELTATLGIKSTKIPYNGTGFGKHFKGYSVTFSTDINPFLTRNEDFTKNMLGKNLYKSKYRYIKKIEKIDMVPTKCLSVDSEDHTYLAGKSLIRTHNTNKRRPKRNKYSKAEGVLGEEGMYNNKIDNYTMQLSIYAYCMEKAGFEVKDLWFNHYEDYDPEKVKKYKIKYEKDKVSKIFYEYEKSNS